MFRSAACSIALAACAGASATACPDLLRAPLTVKVTEVGTGLEICDASVALTDPAGRKLLAMASGSAPPCTYTFIMGGSGVTTYTLNVSAAHHVDASARAVTVPYDSCGSADSTTSVSVQLVTN